MQSFRCTNRTASQCMREKEITNFPTCNARSADDVPICKTTFGRSSAHVRKTTVPSVSSTKSTVPKMSTQMVQGVNASSILYISNFNLPLTFLVVFNSFQSINSSVYTKSAPYRNESRRNGNVPTLTIGARITLFR